MFSPDWRKQAACKNVDSETLFVAGAQQQKAKRICRGCEVRTECLAEALDCDMQFGVWGGMTERERRALLKRRPEVTSWSELLSNAREEYDRTHEDGNPDD